MKEPTAPPQVVVKETGTLRGRGVFTCRAYRAGEVVEESPIVNIDTPFADLPEEVKKIAFNWGVLSGGPPGHALALGYGSLYNHDNPANVRYEADPKGRVLRFIAARDINCGEELTVNYNAVGGGAEWHDDNWFDRMGVTPIASSQPSSPNVVRHSGLVARSDRQRLNGHRSLLIWFTGLSGSGKSTLAHAVEKRLSDLGCRTYVLDGDNVRHGLCSDLGFSLEDRRENLRRIGETARLFLDAGVISLAAFISPFRADRRRVRDTVGADNFLEVYCRCPLSVCEQRDTKGFYSEARAGIIQNYTAISSPYEEPKTPDLVVETSATPIEDCVVQIERAVLARIAFLTEASPDDPYPIGTAARAISLAN